MMVQEPLPAPFDRPPSPAGPAPRPETIALAQSQIDALLARTPAYHALPETDRERLRARLAHIGAYAAELARDAWAQTRRLGQTPLVRTETVFRAADAAGDPARDPQTRAAARTASAPLSRTQAARADLQGAATGRVGDITQSTLRAIAFPTFVADLINGVFDAIIGATIRQMQEFMNLVEQVSKSVDEFMRDNITDGQAMDWLTQSFPGLMAVSTEGDAPRVMPTEAGETAEGPVLEGMQNMLGLPDPVRTLDEETINEQLVPAARRRLAESRLQMLSSMVMLGLQRIVIRHGRLRATMGFHIDASDRAHAEEASSFDVSHSNTVSGMFYVAFSARTSVAYVSSQKSDSDSAINVQADLTGEVDLTFETDYLPLNRLARAESIERIRGNTPNPAANAPINQSAGMTTQRETGPSAGQMVSERMKAHADRPAQVIPDSLLNAAAGSAPGAADAVRAVSGAVAGGAAP